MKNKFLIVISLILIFPFVANAQRRGRYVKAKPKNTAGMKIYKSMIPATAKVMFIDSIVVDKNDFLKHIPLNTESGYMAVANPKADFANQVSVYQNELGLRRIYAAGDSAKSLLYTQTMLGDKWSRGMAVSDFDDNVYLRQNYPFLAADGVTLYFSAEGPESMGGRDIFMSSFNSDESSWYKPQNLGLPYNSTANDYLLAIDDLDTLGWLVTDRRQPNGKVCIYTFAPTEMRLNFDSDDLDDDEIEHYSRITSIKDTWKFGNRKAALARREKMFKRMAAGDKKRKSIFFVINDNRVVTSMSQFHNPESRRLFSQIKEINKMKAQAEKTLEKARQDYHNGKKSLAPSILNLEKHLQQYRTDIFNLEQKIRKLENE